MPAAATVHAAPDILSQQLHPERAIALLRDSLNAYLGKPYKEIIYVAYKKSSIYHH